MNRIANFIWEPIKEPVLLLAAVALGVILINLASLFCFAGMLLCIQLEWFDWKFSVGIVWAVVALWIVLKLIHEL
jgi:hypothetical protein